MDTYSVISVCHSNKVLKLKIPLEVAKTVKTLVNASKNTDTLLYDLVYEFPADIVTSAASWKAYCGWKKTGDVGELDKEDLVMVINIVSHMESMHNPGIKSIVKKYVDLWFLPTREPKLLENLILKKDSKWTQFHEEFQNPRLTQILEEYMTKTGDDWINKKCSHENKYRLIHKLIDARVELDQRANPDTHYNTTIWNFFNRDVESRLETECLIAMTYHFFESDPQQLTPAHTLKDSYKNSFQLAQNLPKLFG